MDIGIAFLITLLVYAFGFFAVTFLFGLLGVRLDREEWVMPIFWPVTMPIMLVLWGGSNITKQVHQFGLKLHTKWEDRKLGGGK